MYSTNVGMASFENTHARLEVTDASFTPYENGYKLHYYKDRNAVVIFGLVFSKSLWFGIFGLLLISLIFFSLDSTFNFKSKRNGFKILEAVLNKVKLLFTNTDEKVHTFKVSIRLHLFFLGLFGALLVWAYSGLLVSYFSIETKSMPITTFEDLLDQPNLKILMRDGGSSMQLLLAATKDKPQLQNILMKNIKFGTFKDIENEFLNSNDKSLMIFGIRFLNNLNEDNKDKLCEIEEGYLDGLKTKDKSGWLYPKNSMLKSVFDPYLLKLSQIGKVVNN